MSKSQTFDFLDHWSNGSAEWVRFSEGHFESWQVCLSSGNLGLMWVPFEKNGYPNHRWVESFWLIFLSSHFHGGESILCTTSLSANHYFNPYSSPLLYLVYKSLLALSPIFEVRLSRDVVRWRANDSSGKKRASVTIPEELQLGSIFQICTCFQRWASCLLSSWHTGVRV
jgi:hypothetical protein